MALLGLYVKVESDFGMAQGGIFAARYLAVLMIGGVLAVEALHCVGQESEGFGMTFEIVEHRTASLARE